MNEKLNSSIDKTLSILETIAQNAKGLSLADIVKSVGIPKTTAFRILEILSAREYVSWEPDSEKYSIGIKALEIGISGLVGQDIVDVSIPYLQDLSATVGETSFLAVYNNGGRGLPLQSRRYQFDSDHRTLGQPPSGVLYGAG